MNDQLWRMTWALPLVIVIGVALIYWLKHLGLGGQVRESASVEPVVRSNTALTDHTRVLVVELEQQQFVVFESTAQIAVQPVHSEKFALSPPGTLLGRSPLFPWRPQGRKPR